MEKEINPNRQKGITDSDIKRARAIWTSVLILSALLFALFTVYDQVFHRVNLKYIWDEQLRFHRWVIEGTSIDPWQYRILTPYSIEAIRWIFDSFGFSFSYGRVFFGVRLLQNFLIFLIFPKYLSRLKVNRNHALLGMVILA